MIKDNKHAVILANSLSMAINSSKVTGKFNTNGIIIWKFLKDRYEYSFKQFLVTKEEKYNKRANCIQNFMDSVQSTYPDVCFNNFIKTHL